MLIETTASSVPRVNVSKSDAFAGGPKQTPTRTCLHILVEAVCGPGGAATSIASVPPRGLQRLPVAFYPGVPQKCSGVRPCMWILHTMESAAH